VSGQRDCVVGDQVVDAAQSTVAWPMPVLVSPADVHGASRAVPSTVRVGVLPALGIGLVAGASVAASGDMPSDDCFPAIAGGLLTLASIAPAVMSIVHGEGEGACMASPGVRPKPTVPRAVFRDIT
jgi:hypothetical protein